MFWIDRVEQASRTTSTERAGPIFL
uniref:Uncharacterized protein n=1 Tax=Romanomermis culicivorax TaxID=13658 RepID=A0A915KHN4_ROMCU